MMEKKTNIPPGKVFCCGPIRAAVWSNPTLLGDKMAEKQSIKITKRYIDKDTGEWMSTNNLFLEDLPKVAVVANEVYRHFRVSMWENEETEDPTSDKSVCESKSISSAKDQEQ
jgi:hypothetical protein